MTGSSIRPTRVGAVVQARMRSTRLPGKVLLDGVGKPLLGHLLERLAKAETLETIVVATSTDPRDDAIADYCAGIGVPTFRGSEHDVLDRYYRAARAAAIDPVVRVTADCPLIDPTIVDRMVRFAQAHPGEYDLVTNRRPLTFPDGLDLDVIPFASLERAWREADTPQQREHTIPFFWERGLRIFNLEHPDNLFARYRWTLDYPEDYAVIRHILRALYRPDGVFLMQDILDYLVLHPSVATFNAKYLPATEPLAATSAAAR